MSPTYLAKVPPRRRVDRAQLLAQLKREGAKVDRAARVLQQFGRLPLKALLGRIVWEDGTRVGS